jgi:hypothetical protein
VPLFPPEIPHDLTWDRAQAAAVGIYKLFYILLAKIKLRLAT